MPALDTIHKRKSAVLTSIIGVLILIIIFMFGLTYLDPPEEFGIAVNFGTTDFGSGNVQPTEALKPASQAPEESEPVEEPIEEPIEEIVEEVLEELPAPAAAEEESAEEVITQNNEEAIAIKKREEAKKKKEAEALAEAKKEAEKEAEKLAEANRQAKAKRKAEAERQAEIERQRVAEAKRDAEKKAAEEAKRKNLDALVGGFSDGDGKADGGEGDDNQAGDKGKETGDPNAKGYYGIGGDGSGGNYQLSNRNVLNTIEPEEVCEEGTVVVKITVDQSGKVISAVPGAQGTNNSASCLYSEAKEAALNTKFNVDSKAPVKQYGFIIYNFSYSKSE